MTRIHCLLSACSLALAVVATAQTPLPTNSPFGAGTPPAGTAARDPLEFTGVTTMGKKAMLIFTDTATKKKTWVNVGETSDGITAVSYDAKTDQAVVKVNGVQKTLALKAATAPTAAAPAPAPTGFNMPTPPAAQPAPTLPTAAPTQPAAAPAAPQPNTAPAKPQTPEEQAKAETEARMLVSDLLEIGMAQRKAYEEAQRKAADGGTAQQAQPAGDQQSAPAQPQQPPAATPPPAGR